MKRSVFFLLFSPFLIARIWHRERSLESYSESGKKIAQGKEQAQRILVKNKERVFFLRGATIVKVLAQLSRFLQPTNQIAYRTLAITVINVEMPSVFNGMMMTALLMRLSIAVVKSDFKAEFVVEHGETKQQQ